jgi:hypothetical protein
MFAVLHNVAHIIKLKILRNEKDIILCFCRIGINHFYRL